MDPITTLPAVVAALQEAGPWLSLAVCAIILYVMQVRRNDRMEKKLEEREDAFRRLAITMAGVNAKNLGTLRNIRNVLIQNQAAVNKTESRLESVADRVKTVDNKLDIVSGRVIELCTHARG